MGGSSSKQEVSVKNKPLKNYNDDEKIKEQAAKKGVETELLAYQMQKTDK